MIINLKGVRLDRMIEFGVRDCQSISLSILKTLEVGEAELYTNRRRKESIKKPTYLEREHSFEG